MKTICRIMMLIGVVLLSACHTTRHTVSEVGVVQDQQSSHQEQTTTQRLDSLFSKLSVSADSITIDLYDSAPPALPQADSLAANPNAQAQPVTAKPARKERITIHQPRIFMLGTAMQSQVHDCRCGYIPRQFIPYHQQPSPYHLV